jgi:hypothetical protein
MPARSAPNANRQPNESNCRRTHSPCLCSFSRCAFIRASERLHGCVRPLRALEELHLALMLHRGSARLERSQIAPPAGLGVFLPRIQPILARCQFANHIGLRDDPLPLELARSSPAALDLPNNVQLSVPDPMRRRDLQVPIPHCLFPIALECRHLETSPVQTRLAVARASAGWRDRECRGGVGM